jgi:hypothetical protein
VITLDLDADQRALIYSVHDVSDWVFTIVRAGLPHSRKINKRRRRTKSPPFRPKIPWKPPRTIRSSASAMASSPGETQNTGKRVQNTSTQHRPKLSIHGRFDGEIACQQFLLRRQQSKAGTRLGFVGPGPASRLTSPGRAGPNHAHPQRSFVD